jgi:hypothetical protein
MHLSNHEWWGLIHGMGFGAVFLLAFSGALAGLYSLRPELVTAAGVTERMRRLRIGVVAMALAAWGTVITGTWVVYPWYRDKSLTSPKSILLSNPDTKDWHNFAMEWKEHIAWLSPIVATAVAFIVLYYGTNLIRHNRVRNTAIALLVLSFAFAAVAGTMGALITKSAPVH